MRDNLLKILLEGAVAIPYSDDTLKLLDESCRVYNKDDSLKVIDELAPAFITGENPRGFALFLSNRLQESNIDFRLPEIVIRRLALYTCLVNIDECAADDVTKYILATMFMNFMFLAKGRFDSIPHPEEKQIDKIKVLSVAPLLGEAIMRIFHDVSVSRLFDK